MKRVLLALPVLAAGGLLWRARGASDVPIDPPSPAAALDAARPARSRAAPRTGADALGINEAVTLPIVWIQRGLIAPEQEANALTIDADMSRSVGARIVRANSPVYPYLNRFQFQEEAQGDWTRADTYFRATGGAGLDVLAVIGPWPGNQTAAYTARYVPDDLPAYEAWVQQVVERYDGDGQGDMPGLTRGVVAWEVDNEPDLHHHRPPRDRPSLVADPSQFESPEEYARVLVATARAIRAADPDATVLSGGIFFTREEKGRSYLDRVFQVPGARDAVDVLSLHCYHQENSVSALEGCAETGRRYGKPYWVTETSVPSDEREPWATQAWQAQMVAATYGALLAAGAERVFWHALTDAPAHATGPKGPQGAFGTNSLFGNVAPDGAEPRRGGAIGPGSRHPIKPAGEVYQRLSAHLAQVDPTTLAEVPTNGGRLLRAGDGWLAWWGTPELPPGATTTEDLRTGETAPAGARVTAPAWIR